MAETTVAGNAPNEGSKLKIFIGLLKKFIGVPDLAAVRFSLPAQLFEPTPNLEYWNYVDAPNAFASIGNSDDELDRMLEVLRFWFTKDLKYAKGKPIKPFNSCLGEFFRCNWETEDNAPSIDTKALRADDAKKTGEAPATISVSVPKHEHEPTSQKTVRISYLTEQTSHHPPVSAFMVACPAKGLRAYGFDQLSAKFTGTTIKVLPGEHNLGIFITLDHRNGETYRLTHPAAHLGGFFRGNLNITVSEVAYIVCPQTKLKAILQYYDDGWLGRTTNKVRGAVFRYDPDNDDKLDIKDVPQEDILLRFGGPWKEKVNFTFGSKPMESHPANEQHTIIDLGPLNVAPKTLPPIEKQQDNESRKLWSKVSSAIKDQEYSKATTLKVEIEEYQRSLARERVEKETPFQPVFFKQATGNNGQPQLTEKGEEVLRRAQEANWDLDGVLP